MKILYSTVNAWPASLRAIERHAKEYEVVQIDSGDWRGYWRAIADRWGQDDLLLVEQDIVLHAEVIPGLEDCPDPWCLYPYRHPSRPGGWMDFALGCTRFRKEFQQSVTIRDVAEANGRNFIVKDCPACEGQPRTYECWRHLDAQFRDAGLWAGFRMHVHSPSVGHREVSSGEPWTPEVLDPPITAME